MKSMSFVLLVSFSLAVPATGCSDDDSSPRCGNGIIDPELGETCDGERLGGRRCEDFGYTGGTLTCHAHGTENECTYDFSFCQGLVCGNNLREGDEDCDGSDVNGESCQSLGHDGGNLRCRGPEEEHPCTFDTSGCLDSPYCGDGVVDKNEGEFCDGMNLDGQSCQSLGYLGGQLSCSSQCQFETSGCTSPVCGNNTREADEVCDGSDLVNQTCVTRGYIEGELACLGDCTGFDESGCSGIPFCGNNVREGTETCDGTDLAGQTCQSMGFLEGDLACLQGCQGFDTSDCSGSLLCVVDHSIGLLTPNTPVLVAGDLNNAPDNNYTSCSYYYGLTDRVISFQTNAPADLTISCYFADYPYHYVGLFASTGGYCDENEIGCWSMWDYYGNASYTSLPAGSYYLILETEGYGSDAYEITLASVQPEICDNGIDDNSNGLTDCDDADLCCSQPACISDPSCAGFDGQPCTADASCLGGICMEETVNGFPGGLCTRDCSSTYTCPGQSQCIYGLMIPQEICLPPCPSGMSSDCRPGYTCLEVSGDPPFCFPDCGSDTECVDTSQCNLSSGACEGPKGLVLEGGPCASDADCESGMCFTELDSYAPGGYCTSFCRLSDPVCPGDAVCVDFGNWMSDVGFCFDGCVSQTDCRTGYTCQSNPYNPPPSDAICTWM